MARRPSISGRKVRWVGGVRVEGGASELAADDATMSPLFASRVASANGHVPEGRDYFHGSGYQQGQIAAIGIRAWCTGHARHVFVISSIARNLYMCYMNGCIDFFATLKR